MGEGAGGRLHNVSCYAPTTAAKRDKKKFFFQELENILFSVPKGEQYIMKEDFNARIGEGVRRMINRMT